MWTCRLWGMEIYFILLHLKIFVFVVIVTWLSCFLEFVFLGTVDDTKFVLDTGDIPFIVDPFMFLECPSTLGRIHEDCPFNLSPEAFGNVVFEFVLCLWVCFLFVWRVSSELA